MKQNSQYISPIQGNGKSEKGKREHVTLGVWNKAARSSIRICAQGKAVCCTGQWTSGLTASKLVEVGYRVAVIRTLAD